MTLYPPSKFKLFYATLVLWINAYLLIQHSTSIIQHSQFQHSYVKHYSHATFMSVLRIMQYACCPIQHSCFRYSQTNNHKLNSISFYLHVTLISFIAMFMLSLCVMVQSVICLQHNAIFSLDTELHAWVSWPWDSKSLCKNLWTQNSLHMLPQSIPGVAVMGDKMNPISHLQRPQFIALQINC